MECVSTIKGRCRTISISVPVRREIASPRVNRTFARPSPKPIAAPGPTPDSDVSNGPDEDSKARGRGDCINVAVYLIDRFEGALFVGCAVLRRARQALQVSRNGKHAVIGKNELREAHSQASSAMHAAGPTVLFTDSKHVSFLRNGDAVVGDHGR